MNLKRVILYTVTIYFVVGCENTFEPLQENVNYTYSIYGLLDVHADTQWVRVMPIGDALIPTDPAPNGTTVKLSRESTGENIILIDSLYRFGNDSFVWNYWTTQPLQPNEQYTLIAEGPDGQQSRSSVTLPSALPVPEINYSQNQETISVSGQSYDPLVVAEVRYLVQATTNMGCAPEVEVVFSHLEEIVEMADGEYSFFAENRPAIARELGVNAFGFVVNRRELVIASAGEDWPDLVGLTEEEIYLPDNLSNVENGTGYVAGIARHKILISPRQEPC